MIEIEDLSVRFGGVHALESVTLSIGGDVTGIVGPNGAGKTTLVNALSGFVTPAAGTVRIDGEDLLAMAPYRRARWGLARSFQKVETVPELSVEDAVRVAVDPLPMSGSARRAAIGAALAHVGLEGRARATGAELDTGERRSCEIARCLVARPRVVLLDEPGGGLSEAESGRLRGIIAGIPDAFGSQVLLIDHDVELIRAVCAETVVLDFGRLIAFGPTADALADERVRAAYLGLGTEG